MPSLNIIGSTNRLLEYRTRGGGNGALKRLNPLGVNIDDEI